MRNQQRAQTGERDEQVWKDYTIYYSNHAILCALDTLRSDTPINRTKHCKLVRGIYDEMVRIEAKYPFIEPRLTRLLGDKPIAEYISGRER